MEKDTVGTFRTAALTSLIEMMKCINGWHLQGGREGPQSWAALSPRKSWPGQIKGERDPGHWGGEGEGVAKWGNLLQGHKPTRQVCPLTEAAGSPQTQRSPTFMLLSEFYPIL